MNYVTEFLIPTFGTVIFVFLLTLITIGGLWFTWYDTFGDGYGNFTESLARFPLGIVISISIVILIFLVNPIWKSLTEDKPNYILFAAKVVNSQTREWPNNRLVLLFLQGREVARTSTSTGEFLQSGEGVTDGLFSLQTENPYQLNKYRMYLAAIPYKFDNTVSELNFSKWPWRKAILYSWLGNLEEGSTIRIPIPSKNIEYVIKILQGDINSLPTEMLQPGSTRLRDDGQIIVALPGSVSTDGTQNSGIFVQDISYATKTEQIETNKLTVPINNCAGSVEVSQKYTQTQTFVHQYTGEIGFNIGVEIPLPLWAKLTPEFTAKYGFENGQIDTRSVEYNMAAAPGTNVMYIVTWSEVWESGAANVINGNDTIVVPFRVKTNLIYDIASEPRTCP